MASLKSGTTIGTYTAIHTNNIGSYALTSVPSNVITTSGGQTIAGITYFSNGESLNLYGIRGRFTNEYIHLYNKVGIGHPSGWGQGQAETPNQGLSTYGGLVISYGTGATSTFYGRLDLAYSSDRYQLNFRGTGNNWWITNDSDKLGIHLNGVGDRIYFATDGNIWSSYYNDWLSNIFNSKQNASTAITTSNIGSQSVSYASSAGNSATTSQTIFSDLSITGSAHKYLTINPGNGYEAMVRYIGGSGSSWYVGKRTSSQLIGTESFHFYSEAAGATVGGINPSGDMIVTGSMRAPIFYDSQDTGFYVNPNGYSNLSQVNTNELFIDDQKVLNSVAGNGATGTINAVWGLLKPNGKKIYPDEEFADGTNSVSIYNNNGGSAVSIVRKNSGFVDSSAANMPNKTGYVLEIMHAPTTSYGTSPGYGGWYFATWTAPSSSRLLCIFKMKVPAGRYLNWASNSIGSGGSGEWLTSNAGTGQYQDYAYLVHSGTSSFSSTHFFFITGGSSDTFYTYLASATVYDITDVSNDFVFRQTASADMRAPIFYDSQDLGYYVDPNATSNLAVVNVSTINPTNTYVGNAIYFGGANNYLNWTNSRIYSNVSIQSGGAVYSSDWFRSYGSNGWYNESYGGGIYMTDGTWVRVYNNKQFLVENLIQSNTAVYAPIFYDSADNSYYLNPNGSSNLNAVTANQYYANGWFRNYGTQGIYNESYGTHFYSNGGASWAITGSGGNVELQFRSNHQNTIRGYVYADTSNQIGFLHSGGGWSFRTTSDKNALIHGTDLTINADGAYASNIIMNDGDEGARVIHCNSNRIGFLTQAGNWGSWCDDDGNWTSIGNLAGAYLYSNYSVRVGEIWGQGGLYRSSGMMLFGTENEGWRFSMANSQKMYIGTDGNIWMAWAGDYISNLLAAKLSTSGKAADSEAVDGIDSSRIVYGDGARASTYSGNMDDPNQKSGFHFANVPTGQPFGDWWNWITIAGNSWQSSNNYSFQIAHAFHSDDAYIRRMTNGTAYSWRTLITSGNIASQSVNYANSAGDSTNLGGRSSSRYLYYRGISSSGDFQSFQSSESIIRFDQVNDHAGLSNPPGGYGYGGVLSMRGDNFGFQIWGAHTGELWFKTQWNNDQYSGWRYIVHSGNIGSQSVNYANSAGSAGTWSTARNLTIGASTKSINGSANVSFSLAEIDAAPRGIDATINVMTDGGMMQLVFQKGALTSATPI